ncbi:MAG: aspartyl protease family protein [Proteobacteria bacterium]|nr:aspartyl protease family protein [Pseudomonadota bacterium]
MRHTLTAFALLAFAAAQASSSAYAASTPAEILDANKNATASKLWDSKATLKVEYAYSGQGMTGKVTSLSDLKTGRYIDTFAIGPMTGANAFDGVHGWAKDPSGTITAQDGADTLPYSFNEAYRRANLWWRADRGGATITVSGEKTDAGATYDVLSVSPKSGEKFEAWFDAKTHLLSRVLEYQGPVLNTTTLSNYRGIDGVLLAGTSLTSTGDKKYDQTATLTTASFLPAQDASAFAKPVVKLSDFSIAGNAKETTFPFQLLNNHIYANVSVNGKGPFLFIFDTGGVNVVTPPLVKQLGLKSEGKLEGRGAGDATMEMGMTKVSSIQLGNASIKDQLFISAPLDQMSPIEGTEMIGMIGFETFHRFVTRIDYGAKTITLIDPKSFDPKDAGTPVKIAFNGNVPEAEGTYDGIPGKFMIDTGARMALSLTTTFSDKYNLRGKASAVDAVTGWGVGGPTRSSVLRGGLLMIGSVEVDHPLTLLSTDKGGAMSKSEQAGNIGGGVLKRFIVTFDYEHSLMYLKSVQGPIADLDTFDRAGAWINRDDAGFKVVDVTAKGPADTAGLKAGDIVVAVDGRPAKDLPLPELRTRLRNDKPGTVVTFQVKHGNQTKDVAIMLRDQV